VSAAGCFFNRQGVDIVDVSVARRVVESQKWGMNRDRS
jgi:hypothetical protein